MKEIKGLQSIKDSFKTKQVKFGGYAALITAALIVGLILTMLIIDQFSLQLDMTEDSVYSLSEQSVEVINQIDSPVNIYGIWEPGQENTDIKEVLDLYISRSRNIRFQSVDPDRNPGFLMQFDPDRQGIGRGSVIVQGNNGYRVISQNDMFDTSVMGNRRVVTGVAVERRITNALIYAQTGETPVIYEIFGHYEIPLEDLGLGEFIYQENYEIRQLNLFESEIPDDAFILAIISPRSDLSRVEADRILGFLERGGRLLVMADFNIPQLEMLNEVLASYGIRYDYGVVIENSPSARLGDLFGIPSYFLGILNMEQHQITGSLMSGRSPIIFPYAMGLSEIETRRRSISIAPLLSSSDLSLLRTDMSSNSLDPIPSDQRGPIITAMAVSDPGFVQEDEIQTRIVAVGSSAVISTFVGGISVFNPQLFPDSNIEFIMNSLSWLDNRPEAAAIRSKSVYIMPMRLNALEAGIFAGVFVIIIPLAFFISGLVTWLKRRHL